MNPLTVWNQYIAPCTEISYGDALKEVRGENLSPIEIINQLHDISKKYANLSTKSENR